MMAPALLAVLLAAPAAADGPMPIELAFARKQLARENRFALTADGKRVAYVVQTPPRTSPPEARYLPNDVPSYVRGNAVFVTDLATGATRAVAAEGGNCWRPWWSRDGSKLAMYCDAGGMPQLWVYDSSTGASRRVSEAKIKAKLWVGDEPLWSADGREVFVPLAPPAGATTVPSPAAAEAPRATVYRSGKETEGSTAARPPANEMASFFMRENNAAVAAIDVASGAVRILVPADATPPPSVLQVSPSGSWVAYLSVFHKPRTIDTVNYQDLVVVPAAGGPTRTIAADIRNTEGDYYLNAYAWHPTRDQLFWVKDKQLWTADLASGGEARRLGAELGDFTAAPLAVTRDGGAVVAGIKPVDMHDYRDPYPQALAIVPLAGGAAQTVALPDGMLLQAVVKRQGSMLWQPQPDAIVVVARESATTQDAVLRLDNRSRAVSTLWKGMARLRLGGAPEDHRFLLAALEDVNTPGNLYTFDAAFANRKRVTEVEPRLASLRFGAVETFESLAPRYDGSLAPVTTAVLLPAGAKRGDRLPAIVFLYPGGKVTRSAAEFGGGMPSTVPVSVFTTRGYAVLLAELPIGPDGVAGRPLPEMVEVLLPQVYHAAELGYVDLNRVAVSGQSYGGYGTASVVSGTNLFRAAIAISGLYDLPGRYSWMDRNGLAGSARWSETGQGRMGTHPWADLLRYVDNSPYYQADRIHTPLLMLHGEADNTCPVEDARKMFNALKRLDRTAQLATYAGEGHVVYEWSTANAVDGTSRMIEFLDRYLKRTEAGNGSRE
jgi:dipeptidyl aminopeptidase/acylaminoacyl peptidase